MLLAATLSVGIYCAIARTTTSTVRVQDTDRATLLTSINNLRRTLMKDNIDYYAEDNNKNEKCDDEIKDNDGMVISEGSSRINNFYIPELTKKISKQSKNKDELKQTEHKVSNTDLLYYVDDHDLVYKKVLKSEKDNNKVTTERYKVLKLKHNYRRAEQARLIQEESKEKVVIVNINKGPIPEMRLPKSRRQYMHDHGEVVVDDEEVPPPLVNTSDPEAAPGEYTVTETATTETVKQ